MTTPAARRVQRAFSRAAAGYDAAADVQRAVVEQLLARLPTDRPVSTLLDIGCGTGFAFAGLRQRFPAARLLAVDFSAAMLSRAASGDDDSLRLSLKGFPPVTKICANATLLPLADRSAELAVSSLTYQWCPLDAAMTEAHRVLQPGGTLAFSTLTGDTFHELRHAFAGLDDAPHVLPLLDPAAVEACVRTAGFVPQTIHRAPSIARFANVRALFDSIRQTGASEVSPADSAGGRRRGLLGKAAYARIESRLNSRADADRQLPLTYDVLYVIAQKQGDSA